MKSVRIDFIPLQSNGQLAQARSLAEIEPSTWYVCTDTEARLHPRLAQILEPHASARPELGIFYGDEAIAAPESATGYSILCKPSFDETQIIAQDYIGWPILVRGSVWLQLGGFDQEAGTASTYDFILRAMSAGIGIGRITEVLALHRRPPPRSTNHDRRAALKRWADRSGGGYEIMAGAAPDTFQLRRVFDAFPNVTLLVPTRQDGSKISGHRRPMIIDFLESLSRTDWPMEKLSVLIGDDIEDGSIYHEHQWPFRVERMITRRPAGVAFNYARKTNELWRAATDEYLVFVNDDIVVRGSEWLRALMTFAMSDDVGGVGARLLYPNGTIQHAGMPMGVFGSCTHAFINRPAQAETYQNWAIVHREWSAVTGAVFATRRTVLEEANGLDERFSLDYNDIDLCLRLRLLGYRIVYTPHAELTHYESVSRASLPPHSGDEIALFVERWRAFIKDDPSYHPNLTRTSTDIEPMLCEDDWWTLPELAEC